MAKIVIAANSAVIVSSVKLEKYKEVLKYAPNSLILYEDEDKKCPIFRVGVGDWKGAVSRYGIEFAADPSADGYAVINVPFVKPDGVSTEDFAFDIYGRIIENLSKIEGLIPGILSSVDEQKTAFKANITVAV